ncbi:hypothetical protein Tco_0451170 [Tanacetum coccineum]
MTEETSSQSTSIKENQKKLQAASRFRGSSKIAQLQWMLKHKTIDLDALLLEDRNKPPTISQLRNQMITYLKHVANKKHAELKSKSFEEIQVLYERYKKQDQTFVAIGSEEDERAIKRMNEQAADKEKEQKNESVHEEVQEEEGAKKRKLGTRRKLKAKRRKYTSSLTREDDDLKMCLHIAPDEDKVVDVEILDHQYPIVEWQSFFLTTKPQFDPTKPLEDDYMNRVTRSNGNMRFFRTLMGVLSIFDREDLKAVYELVMEEYQDEIPEGFDKMLWGDLMIMFNQGDTADFWDKQLNWKLISWKLHSSSGVHTIMTSNGLVIHMLVENRYPLTKEVLSQMLDLKLETEEESSMALELIKFVKQQLEEFEDSNDDDLVTSDHEETERISLLEDMDSESAHMVAASKVPMLKPENGNSATKTIVVKGVEKVIPPTTIEEKTASTHMETQKPLLKDEDGEEVDVYLYRSMIGSLMYLTSSRPDVMFAVCAYARYQVNLKMSHLHAIGNLQQEVVNLLGRLISWQCKKQTVVANSTIEAEYVAASS